jgi:phospholipase A1
MLRKQAITAVAALFALILLPALSCAYADEFDAPHWNVEGYRSDYFMLGNPSSKLNVSFKINVLEDTGWYFAYTQLMMWDLWADSQPMRDLNYNPETFYRFIFNQENNLWLDLGLEHESNGLAGDLSRGWNRVYLRYSSSATLPMEHGLFWSVKAWFPFGYDSTSLDIAKYRGLYEFEVTIRNMLEILFDRDDFTLRIYPGGPSFINPLSGGQELTLRFNFKFMRNFLPIFVIQFFHGCGENLLDDSKEHLELRAGVGF